MRGVRGDEKTWWEVRGMRVRGGGEGSEGKRRRGDMTVGGRNEDGR